MLAMNPTTPLGVRPPALSLATIASMLAPTGISVPLALWFHTVEPDSIVLARDSRLSGGERDLP